MKLCGRALTVLCAATGAVASLPAQRPVQGWSFTWTITSTLRGPNGSPPSMIFDVAVWNGIARITPRSGQQGTRALLGDASVVLVRSGDSVLTVLNAPKREALVATPDELSGLSGGAAAMQLEVSDVSSRTTSGGAAPALDGYAARRVTLDQRYTMSVRMQQMQRTVQVSETTALDLSTALDARDPGFRVFMQQFLRALGKPGAVLAALRDKEGRLPRGVAIRTRAQTVTVTGTDTLRAETSGTMSALQRVPVDTTTFRVPAGYRVTELRRLLQPRARP